MITKSLYKRAKALVPALLGAGLLVGVAPAAASACETAPQSKPFERFCDTYSYGLAPGGSFESGAAGWSLANSAVTTGNESYAVAGGSHALAIQPNGVAVSPAFCVTTANTSLRFFARQTSGSWAVLNVSLRWTDNAGRSHETTVGSLQSGSSWKPSSALQLEHVLCSWGEEA